ncbi:Hsp33 family molecular chaperone HslO [Candidatus Soleaferrea massiliensis]|uniref:Hsp33 family molecular chaperone HslO n=1 Tax=Candidatus Soleaferrea massiliensis TaxID=1470354 RepID=UPI0005916E78|nr:Hsp33 family molecular chaperone HslO [Candidatus Soleaferrea massiliensis]
MGKIVRAISKDGSIAAATVNSTDIASRAEWLHRTSAVVTAALGRLLTAGSLMGSMLKSQDDSLTLRMKGDGPAGSLIVVSDGLGNVKGYVMNPVVELPLNEHGKLDVAGAVGKEGILYVIKDLGLKDPYIGQVPIISGEIAEDITSYYAISEQIPTACGLGVLVNPDLTVRAAGGYLIQLLPGADDSLIDQLEKNMKTLKPVSQMIDDGMTPADICMKILEGFEPEILDEAEVRYQCDCSRERVEKTLLSLRKEELDKLKEEQAVTEVDCHFCNKKYRFNRKELQELIDKSTK